MAEDPLTTLEEIRQRADAATTGPWWFDESDLCWRLHGVALTVPAQLFPDGEVMIPEQVVNGPDGDMWAEWPCPTYADIATVLLGEANTSG